MLSVHRLDVGGAENLLKELISSAYIGLTKEHRYIRIGSFISYFSIALHQQSRDWTYQTIADSIVSMT
jgi:hypothetical protein